MHGSAESEENILKNQGESEVFRCTGHIKSLLIYIIYPLFI
jgi:hypothetical protein